jgi:hypothetical protein
MGSGFSYFVLSDGDRAIFDVEEEQDCRYSKIFLPSAPEFESAISRAWRNYLPQALEPWQPGSMPTYVTSVRKILAGTLPGESICSYHLGRALAAAVYEVASGHPDEDECRAFATALTGLIYDVAGSATEAWMEDAAAWLQRFLAAAAASKFTDLWNVSARP